MSQNLLYDSPILMSGFRILRPHFFPSTTYKQAKMSPRRPTTRRDSFGLEIREDGTIGFNMSFDEVTVTGSSSQRGAERKNRQDDSPSSTGSDSWKNIVSLTRTKRRRDSFGLEVREDGTLSFDQLTTANVDSKTPGKAKRKPGFVNLGDNSLRRTRTQPGRNRRRRDSFGLEIRDDGTLSLDQLAEARPLTTQTSGDNSITHEDRRREARRSGAGGQAPDTEVVQRNRIRPTQFHSHSSDSNSTNRHTTNLARERQPRTNNVEVEMLRERVRVLEAALAGHDSRSGHATEQLPTYQPRLCSPPAGRRHSRSITEENQW
jgi:hypothetical protein